MPDFRVEFDIFASGSRRLAALDEAGRGPLAGPVVASCVVMESGFKAKEAKELLVGLNDSKKMTASNRLKILPKIKQIFSNTSIGIVSPQVIDKINILEATFKAMRYAVARTGEPRPDFLLVDGNRNVTEIPIKQQALVNGDCLSLSIAAASVIAKLTRDAIMEEADSVYPGYGFARHKGYGTREHKQALERLGPCPIHRLSFAPVRACLHATKPKNKRL